MATEHSLDHLVLKPASRAQEIESRKRSSAEWAKWLTLEQYLRREEEDDLLDHAKGGKLVTWVLVPKDDTETLEFVCSCETFKRDILVLPANETKAAPDVGYAVASAFTPTRFRGKGYAARAMSLLHFALAKPEGIPAFPTTWGTPPTRAKEPGIVSVLYSDIGTYYERCTPGEGTGWTIVSPTTTEWIVGEETAGLDLLPKPDSLSRDQAIETAAADAPLFARDLESQGPSSRIHFAFQPTASWCRFQLHREFDEHPHYLASPPKTWGVRMESQGESHFIVWMYEAQPKRKLNIVSMRASPETFPVLLSATKSAARAEKHELIAVWNLDEKLMSVANDLGGRTYERKDHLPAMKWYGQEGDIVWFGNNKLHWC